MINITFICHNIPGPYILLYIVLQCLSENKVILLQNDILVLIKYIVETE